MKIRGIRIKYSARVKKVRNKKFHELEQKNKRAHCCKEYIVNYNIFERELENIEAYKAEGCWNKIQFTEENDNLNNI